MQLFVLLLLFRKLLPSDGIDTFLNEERWIHRISVADHFAKR